MQRTEPLGKLSAYQRRVVIMICEEIGPRWFKPYSPVRIRRVQDTLRILEREGYVERKRNTNWPNAADPWLWRLTGKAREEFPCLCATCASYQYWERPPDHCEMGHRHYEVVLCLDRIECERGEVASV